MPVQRLCLPTRIVNVLFELADLVYVRRYCRAKFANFIAVVDTPVRGIPGESKHAMVNSNDQANSSREACDRRGICRNFRESSINSRVSKFARAFVDIKSISIIPSETNVYRKVRSDNCSRCVYTVRPRMTTSVVRRFS